MLRAVFLFLDGWLPWLMGVLVSTVGEGANEEVDGVRKEKERLTTDHQLGEYYYENLESPGFFLA